MVGNPLTDDRGTLRDGVSAGLVTRDVECSEQCDPDGGQCDEGGNCICSKGRTGSDCSKGKLS